MSGPLRRRLFLMFFLSGFCGLLYQIVWVRLGFAAFGVVTPVLSVILSVFMAGLFLGSWGAGKWVDALCERTGLNGAQFYAIAEATLGLGAFAVPLLMAWGETRLLPLGGSNTGSYLFWSSLGVAVALLPWCIAMGATFPFLLAYLRRLLPEESSSFSFLYLANVLGALAGTFLTAVVLVETLGFRGTLTVAAVLNVTVAWLALDMARRHPVAHKPMMPEVPFQARRSPKALATLFLTGFTSMAMEVVWTRAFAPVMRTEVYSFAGLLLMYLLATWVGSLLYRRHLAKGRLVSTEHLLYFLCFAAIFPLLPTDPRIRLGVLGVLVGIFPFCLGLGYLTPQLIDRVSGGRPHAAGFAYGMNVLGCILGPLAASYFFLPVLGTQSSLVWLAVPYLGAWLVWNRPSLRFVPVVATMIFVALLARTYEDQWRATDTEARILRDHTASVIAYGNGFDKMLLVNGMGMTKLTTITKVMAHLPMAHLTEPKSALVICFGMGTTFRSLRQWNIDVTAVELVPSVPLAFSYFFPEAPEIVSRPGARIIVDDGRRYLRRTRDTYDLITIDPPPPTAAAGSSLLYSREFYELAKAKLKPGGMLQQWLPDTERKTVEAVAKSVFEAFPYVRVFSPPVARGGHHFFASLTPLPKMTEADILAKVSEISQRDLVEWPDAGTKDPFTFVKRFLDSEIAPASLIKNPRIRVSDDRPYNEYYLLRRTFGAG